MYGRVLFGKENRRQYPSLRFFRFCLKHCRWGCRSRCSRASCSLRHCVRLLSAFPFSRPAASSSCVRRPNSRNISAESLVCLCRSIRGHPVSRLRVSYRRDAVSLESAGSGGWAGKREGNRTVGTNRLVLSPLGPATRTLKAKSEINKTLVSLNYLFIFPNVLQSIPNQL